MTEVRPLLLRFLHPLAPPTVTFAYDPALQVNVVPASGLPAVQAGLDVKTQSIVAED